jgi:serine/threonine protein phosphatase PrpC
MNQLNEDSLCLERLPDGTWLFAVADGIGGYEGGEVASALTVATLVEVVAASAGVPADRLAAALAEANRRIVQLQRARGSELMAMGTTLTALCVDAAGRAAVAHVGDSRLYRLGDGGLVQLTKDHNVGTELVREGLIAPEELSRHPQRHMLTRALGAAVDLRPDIFALELCAGDAFLLVTDGLIEALGEDEVARIARAGLGRWHEVGPALAAAAAARPNGDDATAVAVRVEAQGGAAD